MIVSKLALMLAVGLAGGAFTCRAQVFKLTREQMIQYTARNPFERFPDGRPKVPDSILERGKGLSAEEVFGIEHRGYPSLYEDHWKIVKPEKKLVGRAVTLMLVPLRPDVAEVDSTGLPSNAPRGNQISHQSALNLLQPGDVIVIDAHTVAGGIIGDNLAYYICKRAAGFVIDGEIRDLDGIREFDMTGYYREAVPSFLTNCMVAGINVPVTIGKVTVMLGDVVFGDTEGVYFIPPQLAKEVVDRADETHIHDEWTRKKFDEGKYRSIDGYLSEPDRSGAQEGYEEYLKKRLGR
jgi:4-hydroxy-4-methyl-2-oxoglutarate aldolase